MRHFSSKNTNSDFLAEDEESEEEDLTEIKLVLDPKKHFETQFVRSQGPGGQNVNKLNTKVILRI